MMTRYRKSDFEAALKKWNLGEHSGFCAMCARTPGWECKGCPLDSAKGCCGGLWSEWDKNKSEKNAAAIFVFISRRYAQWKKKQAKK
jgi:hypothetical protein